MSDIILVHPKRMKVIVLAHVVLYNMLRAERGAGGVRDLEDEVIPYGLGDGDPAGGHDRNPTNSAKKQRGTGATVQMLCHGRMGICD